MPSCIAFISANGPPKNARINNILSFLECQYFALMPHRNVSKAVTSRLFCQKVYVIVVPIINTISKQKTFFSITILPLVIEPFLMLGFDGVAAPNGERVAAEQTIEGKCESLYGTVSSDGQSPIFRACRRISADSFHVQFFLQLRVDELLVIFYLAKQKCGIGFERGILENKRACKSPWQAAQTCARTVIDKLPFHIITSSSA